MVKVRFAPSPTGLLHIGGARTALFNWLFARHHGGKFFLRIEDTDRVRSRPEFQEEILDSLKWLGLDWDNELYFQTQHLDSYLKTARGLLAAGKAYLEPGPDGKGEAIKFKMPPGRVKVKDLIHGDVEFDLETLKDQVLIKSDGYPAYNFACVVDDAAMEITHVLRGDDHLSNTPKQLVFYAALGITPPQFGHIPLILAEGGGKLSKRAGADRVTAYREEGYLPGAVVNYLALLGWSPGGDRELMSREEMIALFSAEDINDTAAAFNSDKLDWINSQYIARLSPEELMEKVRPQLAATGRPVDEELLRKAVVLYQPRLKRLGEFLPLTGFFFTDDYSLDREAEKIIREKTDRPLLTEVNRRLTGLPAFDRAGLEACLRAFAEEKKVKPAVIIHPLRAALTGLTKGAGLFEIMEVLGKDACVQRIGKWIC